MNIYGKLSGRFFKERARSYDIIELYPNPRLIITGFDGSHLEKLLPKFLDRIKTGMSWVPDSKDLIATGNHTNLAKSNRLFLGLK